MVGITLAENDKPFLPLMSTLARFCGQKAEYFSGRYNLLTVSFLNSIIAVILVAPTPPFPARERGCGG